MFNGYKTVKKRLYTENILLIINIQTAYLVILIIFGRSGDIEKNCEPKPSFLSFSICLWNQNGI